MKSKNTTLRRFTINRSYIFSYPLVLNFFARNGTLEKFEMIEAITFAVQSLHLTPARVSRGAFIQLIEYYLNYEKEAQMQDAEYCVIWLDWIEWLNNDFIFEQLIDWGCDSGINQLPLEETIEIEPYTPYSFIIKVRS